MTKAVLVAELTFRWMVVIVVIVVRVFVALLLVTNLCLRFDQIDVKLCHLIGGVGSWGEEWRRDLCALDGLGEHDSASLRRVGHA